jgi:hypothetical protein
VLSTLFRTDRENKMNKILVLKKLMFRLGEKDNKQMEDVVWKVIGAIEKNKAEKRMKVWRFGFSS